MPAAMSFDRFKGGALMPFMINIIGGCGCNFKLQIKKSGDYEILRILMGFHNFRNLKIFRPG
jgi:hypothetical protein